MSSHYINESNAHEPHTDKRSVYIAPKTKANDLERCKQFFATHIGGPTKYTALNRNPDRTSGKVVQKDISNAQARLHNEGKSNVQNVDDLSALVTEMEKVAGASVRIITENDNVENDNVIFKIRQ